MKNKATWIVVGIVFAIILLIGGLFISSNNKAIFLEEQINAAQADINVAEKRRHDLVFNLVDAVQSYQDYEGETMESIVSARNSMEHGDVEGAQKEQFQKASHIAPLQLSRIQTSSIMGWTPILEMSLYMAMYHPIRL